MLALVIAVASSAAWPGVAAAAVVFDATPPADTNETSATFEFHSSGGGSPPFACSLDSSAQSAFTPCTSPKTFTTLAEGPHAFYVELATGVGAPQPISYTWTVDVTPPTTQVTEQPPALTNSTSATFTFTSPDPTATFRCSLNGGAAQPCASPVVYSSLAEATHSMLIQAVDPAGNVDPQARPITWTVDVTPPTTQVTAQPPALTNSTTATFTFTSPDPTATFRCSLNGAAAQPCTSPVLYSGLADATRSLLIQAVDPAGNVDPQARPIDWTVDSTPPDTTLANPGNLVARDVALFSFTSTEAGSTFQCAFGSAAFSACTSPDAVDVPGSGAHVFRVRAIDGAGNVDPTPAIYRWTSDLTPPKRPKLSIFPDPVASAAGVAPVPIDVSNPGLSVTFTSPAAQILSTPTFTLSTRLRAQWSSDPTATSYDIMIESFPQDSTGTGYHGENELLVKKYSHTKRTALTLHVFVGATLCVKVLARDKVGNTSKARTACTTIPVSFTPRDIGPPPHKDPKAFRGYYIILGEKGYEFVQDIGDEFFFTPVHAALVAERCGSCGVVEFDFDKFIGDPHNKLHTLATVNLNGSSRSGNFDLITVPLPIHRLQFDGMGQLVIRKVSGRPRIAAIGLSSS